MEAHLKNVVIITVIGDDRTTVSRTYTVKELDKLLHAYSVVWAKIQIMREDVESHENNGG